MTIKNKKVIVSSRGASKRMKATPQKDTKAELKIRTFLHGMGFRYRVDQIVLEGYRRKADIVFRKMKIAVFVDGCFWHGCPIHGTWPKSNSEFWRNKIINNKERDSDTNNKLMQAGWEVIRIWEHENPKEAAEFIAQRVIKKNQKASKKKNEY